MSDNQHKVVKRVEPTICPHCKKEIFIGTETMIPHIISLSTAEDIKEAKKAVIDRLEDVVFVDPNSKAEITKWINDENTILDKTDIEPLLKQIALEQLDKKK